MTDTLDTQALADKINKAAREHHEQSHAALSELQEKIEKIKSDLKRSEETMRKLQQAMDDVGAIGLRGHDLATQDYDDTQEEPPVSPSAGG